MLEYDHYEMTLVIDIGRLSTGSRSPGQLIFYGHRKPPDTQLSCIRRGRQGSDSRYSIILQRSALLNSLMGFRRISQSDMFTSTIEPSGLQATGHTARLKSDAWRQVELRR